MKNNNLNKFLRLFIHILLGIVMIGLGYDGISKSILGLLGKSGGYEGALKISFGFVTGALAILALVLIAFKVISILKEKKQ